MRGENISKLPETILIIFKRKVHIYDFNISINMLKKIILYKYTLKYQTNFSRTH